MKIRPYKKWMVECPVCGEEVITDCPAFIDDNTLLHVHDGKSDVIQLDDYRLKWKEAK